MPMQTANELREFHQFLSDRVTANATDLSPEEAVDEWRLLHPSVTAFDEDLAAIRESLSDIAKGDRGMPIDQFDRDFRQRHNFPA